MVGDKGLLKHIPLGSRMYSTHGKTTKYRREKSPSTSAYGAIDRADHILCLMVSASRQVGNMKLK